MGTEEDPLPNEEDDISTLENNSTQNDLITISVLNENGEPVKDLDRTR